LEVAAMSKDRVIQMKEVAEHKSESSLWMVIHGLVYDVTSFLEDHPGGDEVLKDKGGEDATQAFEDIGHSPEAVQQLEKYLIGKLDGASVPKKTKKVASVGGGGAAAQQQEDTPLLKKLIVPVVLVALAYGINYYFMSA